MIAVNSEKGGPRYTALGMFAGAGVGLLTGALFFALLLPSPDAFRIVSTYTLMGVGPLAAGTLVVGLIILRVLRDRRLHPFSAGVAIFVLSLGIAVLVAAVAPAFGGNFFLALIGFGIPIIWCMTVAAMLLPWLSRHRAVSVASLASLGAVSIAGLSYVG
ncbi:hypothetical protein ACFRFH_07770 [Leifsonia sp. NPDC056824]|uniref:hypothetical protein n=1 Tax=Leifsonia sp. NPDC056824 TaxID=3345953 RepID=UPI0036B9EC30